MNRADWILLVFVVVGSMTLAFAGAGIWSFIG